MSDDLTKLAQTEITSTPWWATAPIWLAAGIVGVPSLLAIGSGFFLASNVTAKLRSLEQTDHIILERINAIQHTQDLRWEALARQIELTEEVTVKACIHEAKTAKDRDDCLSTRDSLKH